jgi:hypothetical protein
LSFSVRRTLLPVIALIALAAIVVAIVAAPRSQTATGVVVAVDSRSITDVRGFTLREAGGTTIEFKLGSLEDPEQFPPGHLVEHIVSGAPVLVTYYVLDGKPTVFRLDDAPVPSPT